MNSNVNTAATTFGRDGHSVFAAALSRQDRTAPPLIMIYRGARGRHACSSSCSHTNGARLRRDRRQQSWVGSQTADRSAPPNQLDQRADQSSEGEKRRVQRLFRCVWESDQRRKRSRAVHAIPGSALNMMRMSMEDPRVILINRLSGAGILPARPAISQMASHGFRCST